MLETRAIIIKVEGSEALVEAAQGGGCGHCDSANGCASGKLSKMFCAQPRRFRVQNSIQARVGDEVQVAQQDGVLLRSASILYMLPLALLMAGGFLGSSLATTAASRDGYAALGAVLGLVLGFAGARLYTLWQPATHEVQPVITRCTDMPHRI
jgi:sigma-E factor negative regulatory protein RseC